MKQKTIKTSSTYLKVEKLRGDIVFSCGSVRNRKKDAILSTILSKQHAEKFGKALIHLAKKGGNDGRT